MAHEEKRQHSSTLIPFSYYKCKIPDYFAFVPAHWHNEFEINYITDGSANFIYGDKKFLTQKGDIVILTPNTLHAIYQNGVNFQTYDTIVFNAQMLGTLENDRSAVQYIQPLTNGTCQITPKISPFHEYYDEIKTTVENIISCAKGNKADLDLLMKSELLRLFWLLHKSGDIKILTHNFSNQSNIIKPVIEYVNEHFAENITILTLANVIHFSPSHFMSVFRQISGVSAIEYLTQVRINHACKYLKQNSFSVSEIAEKCGFNNLSNFNRQFKKIVGCTPTEYKKQQNRVL